MFANELKFVLTLSLALLVQSSGMDYVDKEGKLKDCAIYDEAWRVAKCATSLSEGKMISNKLFSFYLQVALRKTPSSSAYTSIGFTTGVDRELVVGKQSYYDFDQWMYTITYDPRLLYKKTANISLFREYNKSVLFFSKTVPLDISDWDDLMIPSLRLPATVMTILFINQKMLLHFIRVLMKIAQPFTLGKKGKVLKML